MDNVKLLAVLIVATMSLGACDGTHGRPAAEPATIVALDARTGAEVWRVKASVATTSALLEVGGVLLIEGYNACPGYPGVLSALDAVSGRPLWNTPIIGNGCPGTETIAANNDIAIACAGRTMSGRDLRTGAERWSNARACGLGFLLADDGLVLGSSSDEAYARDATTGEERWRTTTGPWTSLIATSDGKAVYVIRHDSPRRPSFELVTLDLLTGAMRWRVDLGEAESPPRVTVNEGVVALSYALYTPPDHWEVTNIIALELATGAELWRVRQGGDVEVRVRDIEAAGRRLYAYRAAGERVTLDTLDLRSGATQSSLGDFVQLYRAGPLAADSAGATLLQQGEVLHFGAANTREASWSAPIDGEAVATGAGRVYVVIPGSPQVVDR